MEGGDVKLPVGIETGALSGSQTPRHWHASPPGMGPWQSPHEVPVWMTASNAHRSRHGTRTIGFAFATHYAALNCTQTAELPTMPKTGVLVQLVCIQMYKQRVQA